QILVHTNSAPMLSHIGTITEPEDILGAQFSLPFSVAMRLHHGGRGVHGGNGFWDYLKVDLKDPSLLATARKVKCVIAKDKQWATVDEGVGIEIETTDGRVTKEIVPHSKGLPENPMSDEEVREKFRTLVDPVMPAGRSQEIIAAVDNLENIKN